MRRISGHWRKMTQVLEYPPTLDEVSRDMQISRERAERALYSATTKFSLDSPISEGAEKYTLLDVLQSEIPGTDAQALKEDMSNHIKRAMEVCLDEREIQIICAYFGLYDDQQYTLETLGQELNLTRERVRQLRNRALKKLRRFFHNRISRAPIFSSDLL